VVEVGTDLVIFRGVAGPQREGENAVLCNSSKPVIPINI
jgi:hypothetical protein